MQNNSERRVEVKYCERCGGLWLRWAGSTEPYCVGCQPEMREMSGPWKNSPRPANRAVHAGGAACA